MRLGEKVDSFMMAGLGLCVVTLFVLSVTALVAVCTNDHVAPTADACFICLRESKSAPRCEQYDGPRQCCCAVPGTGAADLYVVCVGGTCAEGGVMLLRCPYDHSEGVCRTGLGDFKCRVEGGACL